MAQMGNTKLVLSLLLLAISFQTLTLTTIALKELPLNPKGAASSRIIAHQLKLMAQKRFEISESEFNQTKKSFRKLIDRPDIDNIVKNVSKIYPGDSKKQAVAAMNMVVKNNPFVFPKLKSFTAFDWLMRFIRQVSIGNSKLPTDGTLYRCFKATYPACMKEAQAGKIASLMQKYECAYRFYTECEYEDYRFALRRVLPLLDFNSLN